MDLTLKNFPLDFQLVMFIMMCYQVTSKQDLSLRVDVQTLLGEFKWCSVVYFYAFEGYFASDDKNQKMKAILDLFKPVVLQVISINNNQSFPENVTTANPVQGVAQRSKCSVQIFERHSFDLPSSILQSQRFFCSLLAPNFCRSAAVWNHSRGT